MGSRLADSIWEAAAGGELAPTAIAASDTASLPKDQHVLLCPDPDTSMCTHRGESDPPSPGRFPSLPEASPLTWSWFYLQKGETPLE